MKKLHIKSADDFFALVARRKRWIALPFLALVSAIVLFAYLLPDIFMSETLILVQHRDVPEDFVKDLISGSTEERLTAIQETVLSRTNLMQILHEFEGNLKSSRGFTDEQKVERLRTRIQVSFQSDRRRGVPLSYFRISYEDQDPEIAQKITSRLAALFIEQDNRVRENQVFGTTEFLSSELEKVAGELRKAETNLRDLKQRYRYELPEQLEVNLRALDRLEGQKKSNVEALDRYISMRMNLERQISETPAVIVRESPSNRAASRGPAINPLVEEYRKKERAFNELAARYTERHPDVRRAKTELERLRSEIPPEDLVEAEKPAPPEPPPVTTPNPVHQSLTSQLHQVRTEIAIREREKRWIEGEISRYTARVQSAPHSEQEMASVLRSHAELSRQYEDLKNKLAQAKLSESLESRQKGTQFVIVDPANYPTRPAKPNRATIILAGLAISLGIALGLGFLADLFDQKVWTLSEVEALFRVPVLAEIPAIVSREDLSRARWKRFAHAVVFLILSAGYAGGLYLVYLKKSSVLKHLDPLIERLMS